MAWATVVISDRWVGGEGAGLLIGPLKVDLLFQHMTVPINLPDDLAEQIDQVSPDRSEFVVEAVRRLLHESLPQDSENEVARINQHSDELNQEAEDVLEYQVIA
jgi:hypothetical protein